MTRPPPGTKPLRGRERPRGCRQCAWIEGQKKARNIATNEYDKYLAALANPNASWRDSAAVALAMKLHQGASSGESGDSRAGTSTTPRTLVSAAWRLRADSSVPR